MRKLASWVALAALAAAAPRVDEPEWPQFRGPASNPVGDSVRLPDNWSATENIEWATPVPGRGWSSPVVTNGRVFVTSVLTEGESKKPQMGTEYSNEYAAALSKQGLTSAQVMEKVIARDIELPGEVVLHYFLYCLDVKTGAVKWKREFHSGRPPGGRHRKNSFSSETPVTDGKLVYVYVGNLGLYAFDLAGKEVWKTPLEAFPIYLDFGTGSSPVLHGDRLFIVNDNEKKQFIAAFDKKTGRQIWSTPRDIGGGNQPPQRSGFATPYIWSHPLRTEIVTIGPGTAISYSLDGNELWRLSGMSGVPVPSAFASGGLLYLNGGRGRSLFAIRPGAAGDISLKEGSTANEFVAWSVPRAGTYLPSSLAYQAGIYTLTETGIVARYDMQSGKLSFKARIESEAASFTASPWAYNGKIFCLGEDGKTYVLAAGDKYQLLRVNSLDDLTLATPAIAGDRLLLRTETKLYSIRARRG